MCGRMAKLAGRLRVAASHRPATPQTSAKARNGPIALEQRVSNHAPRVIDDEPTL